MLVLNLLKHYNKNEELPLSWVKTLFGFKLSLEKLLTTIAHVRRNSCIFHHLFKFNK